MLAEVRGFPEGIDAFFHALAVVGLVGLVEDGPGGTITEIGVFGVECPVENLGRLVRHGLEFGMGDMEGSLAEHLKCDSEVFVLEPPVESGPTDANRLGLCPKRAGP